MDSLSLVRSSSGSLTKKLQVSDGRIEELRAKQANAEASHQEFPSRITAKLLQQIEVDLEALVADRNAIAQNLATDQVVSKSDFFEKLDLTSYEGRVAANNLVKRLDVRISVSKLGRLDEVYRVIISGTLAFLISHHERKLTIRSMDARILDKQVMHGKSHKGSGRSLSTSVTRANPKALSNGRLHYSSGSSPFQVRQTDPSSFRPSQKSN